MERIIKIDVTEKHDLLDKYNEKRLSNELLNYIIKQAMLAKNNEEIKIIVNKKFYTEKDTAELIKEALREEYNRSLLENENNNKRQLFFFILGIIFIFLSTLINEETIWKEVLIIIGWVPIWEMIEVELFPDAAGRKERKAIEKILNSEIIVKSDMLE